VGTDEELIGQSQPEYSFIFFLLFIFAHCAFTEACMPNLYEKLPLAVASYCDDLDIAV